MLYNDLSDEILDAIFAVSVHRSNDENPPRRIPPYSLYFYILTFAVNIAVKYYSKACKFLQRHTRRGRDDKNRNHGLRGFSRINFRVNFLM